MANPFLAVTVTLPAPATDNPIPVGTRVMVVRCPQQLRFLVGACGVVAYPYRPARKAGSSIFGWVYVVQLDHFPVSAGQIGWAFEHGEIVPLTPPAGTDLEKAEPPPARLVAAEWK